MPSFLGYAMSELSRYYRDSFIFMLSLRFQLQQFERETYGQRQSLLEELRVLRQREGELKREAEVNAR